MDYGTLQNVNQLPPNELPKDPKIKWYKITVLVFVITINK